MSLGRHSGATWIGRPLDITVQAVLQAQDDIENLCPDADVFYADNKLDKSRVRVTFEKSASVPLSVLIRIRSAVWVEEPVVTIYLRLGCQQKIERRYVLLAELLPEPGGSSATTPLNNATVSLGTPSSTSTATSTSTLATLPLAPRNSGVAVRQAPLAVRESKKVISSALGQTQAVQSPPARSSRLKTKILPQAEGIEQNQEAPPANAKLNTKPQAKARLKLEPFDLMIEREPQLKASVELLSSPTANPNERAAASALWRALSAQPQDMVRDAEKLLTLENSVRSLQAQSQKTMLSVDALNLKLETAQSERYANGLVYALAALLLLALAGLAYMLRQRVLEHNGSRSDKPWWRKDEDFADQQRAWADSLSGSEPEELKADTKSTAQRSTQFDQDIDFELDPSNVRLAPKQMPAAVLDFADSMAVAAVGRSDFGPSSLRSPRAVKAEELFDVQQEADFFVSIGQHEQAIEVLRSHIAENSETSALIYLDLFNLYHQLLRPADYEGLRANFNQRFNAQIPSFESYNDKHVGLEAYQIALSRIEALWPSPKVLEIIEESLFRQPNTTAEAFNLEAYRELLLLYSVAKEIISPEAKAAIPPKFDLTDLPSENGHSRPITFMPTAIEPLSADMAAAQVLSSKFASEPMSLSVIPPASRRLGLDINLNEPLALEQKPTLDLIANNVLTFTELNTDTPAANLKQESEQVIPQSSVASDNLIDFDIFNLPQVVPEKSKPT